MAMRSVSASVELPDDIDFKEVRDFINANLEDVANEAADDMRATSMFADKTGRLRKSIKVRKSKFEDGGFIIVATAPHAHLIELGHAQVENGKVVGHVAPRPFMRQGVAKAIRSIIARLSG